MKQDGKTFEPKQDQILTVHVKRSRDKQDFYRAKIVYIVVRL